MENYRIKVIAEDFDRNEYEVHEYQTTDRKEAFEIARDINCGLDPFWAGSDVYAKVVIERK